MKSSKRFVYVLVLPFRFQPSTGRRLKKFSVRNGISEFSNYWQGNFTHASIKELNIIRPLRKITCCKRIHFETHKSSCKHSTKQYIYTYSHIIKSYVGVGSISVINTTDWYRLPTTRADKLWPKYEWSSLLLRNLWQLDKRLWALVPSNVIWNSSAHLSQGHREP